MANCGWCGQHKPAAAILPDGDILCIQCYPELRNKTAGMPDCPSCLHRYWVWRLGSWGYRCMCGLKFTQMQGDAEAERLQKRINAAIDADERIWADCPF